MAYRNQQHRTIFLTFIHTYMLSYSCAVTEHLTGSSLKEQAQAYLAPGLRRGVGWDGRVHGGAPCVGDSSCFSQPRIRFRLKEVPGYKPQALPLWL